MFHIKVAEETGRALDYVRELRDKILLVFLFVSEYSVARLVLLKKLQAIPKSTTSFLYLLESFHSHHMCRYGQ